MCCTNTETSPEPTIRIKTIGCFHFSEVFSSNSHLKKLVYSFFCSKGSEWIFGGSLQSCQPLEKDKIQELRSHRQNLCFILTVCVCMCVRARVWMSHLWLLVVSRQSVGPLGSSLSLLISLSWRALRLLSRAASSSSSSFLANLRETKEERWKGWGNRKSHFFLSSFQPSSPFPLPRVRNFKGNNPLNWAVIIKVT